MTNEPIGFDIDGRPLRVGDQVVLVGLVRDVSHNGLTGEVVEYLPFRGRIGTTCRDPDSGRRISVKPENLRKLHKDHRPADESFTEMMDKLKGVRV